LAESGVGYGGLSLWATVGLCKFYYTGTVKPLQSGFLIRSLAFCSLGLGLLLGHALAAAPAPRLPGMDSSFMARFAGQELYYEVGGKLGAPAVVFIHGVGGGNSSMQWRNNITPLLGNYRVYALDLPGFARSGAQAIEYSGDLYTLSLTAFLREAVREPATVIASSLGAAYSIRIANAEPALISKMLLVSPTGLERLIAPRNEGFYSNLTQSILGGVLFQVLNSDSGLGFFLYNQVYLDWRLASPETTDIYRQNLNSPNKGYPIFAFLSQYLNVNITDIWPKTKQAAYIVWGSDDVNTPSDGLKAFQKLRPDVGGEVIAGRAVPNEESPVAFNQIMLKFLAGK
jgi:pimeloyl-ACP methyl ester carboxylesterase